MNTAPKYGDLSIPHTFSLTLAGGMVLVGEDWHFDISLVRRHHDGWEWKVERVATYSYKDGAKVWTFAWPEDDPIVAAAIKHVEEHDEDLDHEVQVQAMNAGFSGRGRAA